MDRGFQPVDDAGCDDGEKTPVASAAWTSWEGSAQNVSGTVEKTAARHTDCSAHSAGPGRVGHQAWVSRVTQQWASWCMLGQDLIDKTSWSNSWQATFGTD